MDRWQEEWAEVAARLGKQIAGAAAELESARRWRGCPRLRTPLVRITADCRWPGDPRDGGRRGVYWWLAVVLHSEKRHVARPDVWRSAALTLQSPREAVRALEKLHGILRWLRARKEGALRARAEYERQQRRWLDRLTAERTASSL